MVKFILGVISTISCTLLGRSLTIKYLYKLKYYECLKRFNLHFKQNLLHKKDNLLHLLDFKCNNNEFLATLSSVKLKKALSNDASTVYFPNWTDEDDVAFLTDYFNSLGENNLTAEVERITNYDLIINEKVSKIADKSIRFSNLGQKLGLAVGVAVFIIIL